MLQTPEELHSFTEKWCRTSEVLNGIKDASYKEALLMVDWIDEQAIAASPGPITIFEHSFKTEFGFALAMDIIGDRFSDAEDVHVAYSKPEKEERLIEMFGKTFVTELRKTFSGPVICFRIYKDKKENG